jgi:hypothetical protein
MTSACPSMGDSSPNVLFDFTTLEGNVTSPASKHAPGRLATATEIPPAVFHDRPLRHELHRSLAQAKLSAEEIAWRLGVSPSYLRRAVLTGQSAVRFPGDLLAAFMRLCGDYRALELIASECDHIAVHLPKARRMKSNPMQFVSETAASFHALMADLIEFFAAPDAPAAIALRERLRKQLGALAAIEVALRDYRQMDLPLEAMA